MTTLPRRRFLAAPLAAAVWPRYAVGAASGDTARAAAPARPPQETGVRRLRHPGFLDLQVNGFAGVDFNDPATTVEQFHASLAALRRTGVTQLLPTLVSAPFDRFARCARTVLDGRTDAVLGIHMEGPYISPEDGPRGAHRREDIEPASLDDFKRRQDAAGGQIRLVTIAPEVPGALPLIEYLRQQGVHAAIGHTAASPEQVRDAIRAGATLSTHLGNGCANMLPRHPNFLWEQLAADDLTASLIIDGHHLPPATVKVMVRAKTPARVVLVTDATAAAGQPPGDYQLGGVRVHLDDTGRVAVPGQPNLAGSALSMDRAVGNMVRFAGVPLDEALAMASTRPATYLGARPAGTLELEWDGGAGRLNVTSVT
jgi:N-acetylglucosamine-6-phosphate deacetylase